MIEIFAINLSKRNEQSKIRQNWLETYIETPYSNVVESRRYLKTKN